MLRFLYNIKFKLSLFFEYILIFLIFVIFSSNSYLIADNENDDSSKNFIVLVVSKEDLKAKLMSWSLDQSFKELAEFKIAVGKVKGDKEKRGDNKTPEGIYITQSIIEGKDLDPKYGSMAITLDYPNPMDRVEKKTGNGIWLHGVINDQRVDEANVTEGCVVFYNSDIIKLAQWLRPNQGIVIISKNFSGVNGAEDLVQLKSFTEEWAKNWSERNIDSYMSYYASSFRYEGKDKSQYKEYKNNIFSSYKNMSVDINNLLVFSHPKYALTIMNQDFIGDTRSNWKGRKALYWIKEDGVWKIRREIYDGVRLTGLEYSKEDLDKLKDSPEK